MHARNFYVALYSKDMDRFSYSSWPKLFPTLVDAANLGLEVTKEDVRKAIFQMSPFKAPGPDGL